MIEIEKLGLKELDLNLQKNTNGGECPAWSFIKFSYHWNKNVVLACLGVAAGIGDGIRAIM